MRLFVCQFDKSKKIFYIGTRGDNMEIKSYKKLRGNVYELEMNDGKSYKLYDDIILRYELLIDKHLDQRKLEKILEENDEMVAYYKAVKYIGMKMRTELEIRKYLKKGEFSSKAIKKTVDKLKKEGYLDQEKYAEAYVNDAINLGMSGPRKMRDELEKLGINDEIIEKYISRVNDEIWLERIERILDKKSKLNKVGEALFKNKMYSELIVLGYRSEDIKSALDNFSIDTSLAFEKEADKMYGKLASKYEGSELALRFKSKMFAKGFDSDSISHYLDSK